MSLQGTLSDLPLIDLMQVLTLQNKTGILSISRNFSQAQVCFTKSKLYSAYVHHTGQKGRMVVRQGEDALYDLLEWPDGQFVFELSPAIPAEQNVHQSWDFIILEQCRREDEQLNKQQKITQIAHLRPRVSANPPAQAEITLNLDDWQVLLQIDGRQTVEAIANKLRLDLNVVVERVQKLVNYNLVELHEAEPAALPTAQGREIGRYMQVPTEHYQSDYNQGAYTDNQVNYYTPPPPPPGPRWVGPVLSRELVTVGSNESQQPASKPKVQRGLLSGIIARIRGL